MRVHMYETTIFESYFDWVQKNGQDQKRLYIPNQGVLGYRSDGQIDFYSENEASIADAEAAMKGTGNGRYLGEIDLPDDAINRLICAGKKVNHAKQEFHKSGKMLIEMVGEKNNKRQEE